MNGESNPHPEIDEVPESTADSASPRQPPDAEAGPTAEETRPPDGEAGNEALPTGGGLIRIAITNPVFTVMMMVGLVVLGLFSFRGLSIDQYPDVSIPVVSIQTIDPGASPEVIEREVTRILEEAVNPIQGVKRITSTSLESVSAIVVQFELGTDIDSATAKVRSKIEQARLSLPSGLDAPLVQQYDPAESPILSLALSSDTLSVGALTRLADDRVRKALEAVDGVGRVQISGGSAREIHVLLDAEAMQARKVSVQEVMTALARQNLEIPAGRIATRTREQLVRVFGRLARSEQFSDVIVRAGADGVVRVGDVATVRDTTAEERSLAMVNGTRAIGIDLLKVAGGNTIEVADGVQEAMAALSHTLPAGVSLSLVRDNSVEIRGSVESVQEELMLGAALTVLIVLLFLGDLRATAITALALPVSVVSTFILFAALGFTLNILTLLALALSIGILIDDAIVVIENIVRHREMGKGYLRAAFEATHEIVLAVLATTLSFVAVFIPVAFMGGVVGKFFYQFGLTVAWAVLVSLFVSFTLTPMLGAWWRSHGTAGSGQKRVGPLRRAFNHVLEALEAFYERVVRAALRMRPLVLVLAAGSLAATVWLFPRVGGSFMPSQDKGHFTVSFDTPSGSTFEYTVEKAELISQRLRALPSVALTYTTIGAGVAGTVTTGEIYVELVDRSERTLSQREVMRQARDAFLGLYNVETAVIESGALGGAQKPIQVQLRGAEIEELERLSASVKSAIQAVPGTLEVKASLGDPKPELRLEVDLDRARDLGLDAQAIATAVRPMLAGSVATTWQDPEGVQRDVLVRLPQDDRTTAAHIGALELTVMRGGQRVEIPLSEVADLSVGNGASSIQRQDLSRVATVSASIGTGANVGDVSSQLREAFAQLDTPPGYSVQLGGESKDLAETTGHVLQSISLAIVLIYLILASQFGSFLQPLAIMVSLPLSLLGVLIALLITGDTINMMSMIGVILLMGLVTKNAILLVDNANHLQLQGVSANEAIAAAGRTRLRPILMTTCATIAGMIPISLALGPGGEFRAPMARAVIGGMITSTLLTLVVIPVIYSYFEAFTAWRRNRSAR